MESIADTRVFGLRPVRNLIDKVSILHANGRQETIMIMREHAFEACT